MRLGVNLFVIVTGGRTGDPGEQGDGDDAEGENPQEPGSAFADSALRRVSDLANGGGLMQHDVTPFICPN
jgi:hypothetical protein